MEPASDSASSKQPKYPSSPKQKQVRGSALREEIAKAAPGTQDLESSAQKPGKEADSQRSGVEAKMATDEKSSAATKDSNNATAKKGSGVDQQEQRLVNLKHKGGKTGGLASENKFLVSALSGDKAQRLALGESSDTIAVKVPVKEEPAEDEEAPHQMADSDGSKTGSGDGGYGHVSRLQPLIERSKEKAPPEIAEHDTETESTQRVDFPDPVQEGSGGGDGGQDNTGMPPSDNKVVSQYQSSGLDVAELDRDKETQPVPLEQDHVRKVKDEPQSGGAASTQTVVKGMSVPEEDDGVGDIGNWMPGDGEDLRKVPRPDQTGAPWDEHDRRGMVKDTGRSDFETARLNVAPKAATSLGQHHQAFTDPVHFINKSVSPHLSNHNGATQPMASSGYSYFGSSATGDGSQHPITQHNLPRLKPDLERQQQLRAQIDEKKRQLENARRLHEESQRQARQVSSNYGLTQSLSGTPPPFPMGPLSYPRAPQTGYQQPMSGYYNTNYRFPMQAPAPFGGMGSSLSPASLLAPRYNLQGHRPLAPNINRRLSGPYAPHAQGFPYHDSGEEEASDDDEPLRTRVKRHPSITSQDSAISASPAPLLSTRNAHAIQREESPDIEFLSSSPKTKAAAVKTPIRHAQPGPSSPPPNTNTSDPTAIDWKLPRFDLQHQPLEKGSDIPSVKISLPNLVREELLLSPDHSAQEISLLLNVFLPSQRALAVPDPAPAAAVLNFHTIALMVIEVFVQYEIGDELGTGRGHWHEGHDQGGEEYVRVRSARDANPDEIFWAVVDRWRAGVESGKKSLEVLRGVQEFCDVALDVIFWVKEHGLLGQEGEEQQQGVGKKKEKGKRGRAAEEAEEEDAGDGEEVNAGQVPEGVSRGKVSAKGKRGTADEPNQVQPRKRAKMQATEGKKKRRMVVTPSVTIMKRR